MKLGSKLSLVGISLVVIMTALLMLVVNYSLSQHERERVSHSLLDASNKFQHVLTNKEQALAVQARTFFQDPLRLAEIENYEQPMSFDAILHPYLQDIGYDSEQRFAAVFHEVVDENDKLSLNLLYPPPSSQFSDQTQKLPAWYAQARTLLTQKKIQQQLLLDDAMIDGKLSHSQTYALGKRLYRIQKVPIQASKIAGEDTPPPVGVFVLFDLVTDQFAHHFILENGKEIAKQSAQERLFDIAFMVSNNDSNLSVTATTAKNVMQTMPMATMTSLSKNINTKKAMTEAIEIEINQHRYLAIWNTWSDKLTSSGYLLMKNYDAALAPLHQLQMMLLFVSAIVLLLAIATMLWLTRSVVQPITRLLQGVKTVQAGNLNTAIPVETQDEIGDLTYAFNQMVAEVRKKEQMEALLAQKEIDRHRSISEMVAGVAHEVNTPLGIVNSAASIIEMSLSQEIRDDLLEGKNEDDSEELGEILEDMFESSQLIQNNMKRTSDLIQRFKSLSVSQMSDELEEILIIDKIEELIMLYKISARDSSLAIHFQHQLDDKTLMWRGYSGYLFQIIQNLLSNIERYAYPDKKGGNVEIKLNTSILNNEKAFCLQISDFGIGMDKASLERIFDAFYTTGRNKGGSGLGMAIVHNLVTSALKGTINVKSMPKKGILTTICFPQYIEN
jgi:signal transduction histidine kinase